jgi:hypothetical protein
MGAAKRRSDARKAAGLGPTTRMIYIPVRNHRAGNITLNVLDADGTACTFCRKKGITGYADCRYMLAKMTPIDEDEMHLGDDLFACAQCTTLVEVGDVEALVERRLTGLPDGSDDLIENTLMGEERRRSLAGQFAATLGTLDGRGLRYVDDLDPDYRFSYRADFAPGSLTAAKPVDDRNPDCHAWIENHRNVTLADGEAFKELFRKTYSYAIPGAGAINAIARHSPAGVVEIGAGNGYWRYLLTHAGVDVEAIEKDPVGMGKNPYWRNAPLALRRSWSLPIIKGDETYLALTDPARTLLMVWPPEGESLAENALRAYQGQTVCYVGEWRAATGDAAFHNWLRLEWDLIESTPIPTFFGFYDRLFVFKRRPRDEVEAIAERFARRRGITR